MTLDDLAGRLFAGVPEVAEIIGADERTIRRAIAAGEIPGHRVGTKYMIPVAWLRELAGSPAPAPAAPEPDLDQLADRVADRVLARLARTFGALVPDMTAAGPVPPGPAATANDRLSRQGALSRVHDNPAA